MHPYIKVKALGEEILRDNRRLTSDGVVTYSERGNDDFHQNVKAKLGEEILRENRRLTSDSVVTYSERGNDDFHQNVKAKL